MQRWHQQVTSHRAIHGGVYNLFIGNKLKIINGRFGFINAAGRKAISKAVFLQKGRFEFLACWLEKP